MKKFLLYLIFGLLFLVSCSKSAEEQALDTAIKELQTYQKGADVKIVSHQVLFDTVPTFLKDDVIKLAYKGSMLLDYIRERINEDSIFWHDNIIDSKKKLEQINRDILSKINSFSKEKDYIILMTFSYKNLYNEENSSNCIVIVDAKDTQKVKAYISLFKADSYELKQAVEYMRYFNGTPIPRNEYDKLVIDSLTEIEKLILD